MSDNGLTWTNDRRKLSDLIPWEHNPRQITEKQAAGLQASIRAFGIAQPMLVSPSGDIYDGHQRDNVLQLMDEYGPDAEVDVRVASRELTEDERRELVVRLHKNIGQFDFDALANLYEPDELMEWGFEDWELDLSGWNGQEPEDAEPQIDRAEELREEWGVETGQLWALGEHRIICGDATDAETVERLLEGDVPLLMVTDPPYGINLDATWRDGVANRLATADSGVVRGDDGFEWLSALNVVNCLVAYVWHHPVLGYVTQKALENYQYRVRQQIIWAKSVHSLTQSAYQQKHEPCWYAVRKNTTPSWLGGRTEMTIWEAASPKHIMSGSKEKRYAHPTQKPLECMERPIRNHEGDVYDPFVGSGTTIIAAENQQRRCYAIDIDPAYVAVSLQRYQDAFGITPELITRFTNE